MTKLTKTPILPPNFDPGTGQKQILFIEAALSVQYWRSLKITITKGQTNSK